MGVSRDRVKPSQRGGADFGHHRVSVPTVTGHKQVKWLINMLFQIVINVLQLVEDCLRPWGGVSMPNIFKLRERRRKGGAWCLKPCNSWGDRPSLYIKEPARAGAQRNGAVVNPLLAWGDAGGHCSMVTRCGEIRTGKG